MLHNKDEQFLAFLVPYALLSHLQLLGLAWQSRGGAQWELKAWGFGCREGKVTGPWLSLVLGVCHRRGLHSATATGFSPPQLLSLLPLFPPAFGLPFCSEHESGGTRMMTAAIFQLPLRTHPSFMGIGLFYLIVNFFWPTSDGW